MGGIKSFLGLKKPKVDNSALLAAQENQRLAREEARAAEVKKLALEEAERKRKNQVAASGRTTTILAGENPENKTLLGG